MFRDKIAKLGLMKLKDWLVVAYNLVLTNLLSFELPDPNKNFYFSEAFPKWNENI